jgi:hypothetical protein
MSIRHHYCDGITAVLLLDGFFRKMFTPQEQFPVATDERLRDALATASGAEHLRAREQASLLEWSSEIFTKWDEDLL